MTVAQPSATVRNQLLASLPTDVLTQLLPRLSPVQLKLRQVLAAANEPIEAVYFPEFGMVSMVAEFEDGARAEVGVIGSEGMVGVPLLSAVDTSFTQYMVQLPGAALRMGAAAFRQELQENASFRTVLLRYNEALQAQIMQTAACNGRHGLEQRLARWLLMAHDRAGKDELSLTQDFIAMMLGVHRPTVTVAARILQRAGLIRYRAGLISVVDRSNLEAACCECYAAVQRRFAMLTRPDRSQMYDT